MKDESSDLIKKIQTSMVESAKTTFEDPELDCLRGLIRLTVEFYVYLHHGNSGLRDPVEHYQHRADGGGQSSDLDELKYRIGSIFSGIESFCRVNAAYSVLVGATSSKVEWDVTSMASLNNKFVSMFDDFNREENFEYKCRLLLDLFKLQIVFAGVFYN